MADIDGDRRESFPHIILVRVWLIHEPTLQVKIQAKANGRVETLEIATKPRHDPS